MPDPYVSVQEIRDTWPTGPIADDEKYPDALLEGLVAEFEPLAERARGVAYRRREVTERRVVPRRRRRITLNARIGVEISSASVAGEPVTSEVIAGLVVSEEGEIVNAVWPVGRKVEITYTHGLEEPPPGIVRACKEFVRAKALATTSNQPRNTLSYTDPDQGYTYRESTASWPDGRYTGLLVVDDAINAEVDYRMPGIG